MTIEDDILEQIAPIEQRNSKKRHSYVIIGKPGCGKTSLAEKLAKITDNQIINFEETLLDMQNNLSNSFYAQWEAKLRNGGEIEPKELYERMIEMVESLKTQSRGFIIDGIPLNTPDVGFDLQMEYLTNLVRSNENCVLIDLRISNQDLVRRRAGLWLDPVTNISYPSQQVLYSRTRRQAGWIDGEEDAVYKEEIELYQFQMPKEKEQQEIEETVEEGEEKEPESEPVKKIKTLANRKAYPILSEKILDRLIKQPENDPENILKDAEMYLLGEPKLELFRKNEFNLLKIVELDATQHPEQLFDNLLHRLYTRGFSVDNPFVPVVKLQGPEGGFKTTVEADIIKFYNQVAMQDDEPEREASPFGKYCPVTFREAGKLAKTSFEIAAKYRGKIYFFADEQCLEKFSICPEKYLQGPLEIPKTNICIIGTPMGGKSTISKVLAKKYKLACISVDELLLQCQNTQDSDYIEFYKKVEPFLRNGGQMPSDLYLELIQLALGKSNTDKGWVLNGFPKTAEQVHLLVQHEIMPDHVYIVQPDLTNENVTALIHSKGESPLSGFSGQGLDAMPFYDEMVQHFNTQELPEMNIVFTEKVPGVNLKNIAWRRDTLETVNTILQTLDPFVPQASTSPRLTDAEPVFGLTRDYCPVTLYKERKLQKGDPNIVAKFLGRYYYFSSDDARSKFLSSPYVFVKAVKIPPPRLAVLGVSGSGKATLMDKVSQKWKIPLVNFKNLLKKVAESANADVAAQIQAVLGKSGNLSADMVKQAFSLLYTQEPYVSQGFIITSFPLSKSDLDVVLKNFGPDAFVILRCESDIASKRKLKSRKDEIELLEKERLQKVAEMQAANTDGTPLETPEWLQLQQTLLLSDEKVLEELAVKFEQENSQLQDFQSLIENFNSIPSFTVNSSKCMRPVLAELGRQLRPYLDNRSSLFLSSSKLTPQKATALVNYGLKEYSKLGRYCPILHKKYQKVLVSQFGDKPVIVGDELFYVQGKQNLEDFEKNLHFYIDQPAPKPMLSSTCCIVGNPKSGKTTLGVKLAKEMNAVHLTVSYILQSILDGNECTSLYEEIRTGLASGASLPDQVVVDAVIVMTSRLISNGEGWVLDGFPTTFEQAELLDKAGFQPHVFLELQCQEAEIIKRSLHDLDEESVNHLAPGLHLPEHNLIRDIEWKQSVDKIKSLYSSKYSNWVEMDATRSKWSLKNEGELLLVEALKRRQTYIDLKSQKKAAPISEVGLSNSFILENRSHFLAYCPVSLVDDQYLHVSYCNTPFMAEFQSKFYYMRDEAAFKLFLNNPERYVGEKLPEELPTKRPKSDLKMFFPKTISFKGYCPVTFAEGPKGFDSIIPGMHDSIVVYEGNLFAFRDEVQLQKFMQRPWKYAHQTLPTKLPPPTAPIPLSGLPVVGYLEQTIATALTKALLNAGSLKPKHPFRTLEQSAKQFVALHLRANNPKSKDWVRKKYSKELQQFEENCELMNFLAKSSTEMQVDVPREELNPYLERFLALE